MSKLKIIFCCLALANLQNISEDFKGLYKNNVHNGIGECDVLEVRTFDSGLKGQEI